LDDRSDKRLWPSYFGTKRTRSNRRGACKSHSFEYVSPDGRTIQVVGLTQYYLELAAEFVAFPRAVESEEELKRALIEDAMLRELTVNALYLRSNNLAILDPSGMGLKDLHDRVFRTPRGPRRTLLADPIRVLRVMKFIGRFHDDGFAPDPGLTHALKDCRIKVHHLTS
jgi:tRNA nucleotidyltransferase/poly(A) polymerase